MSTVTWVKAGKNLLNGKQKKLTKVFGDVVLAKTGNGYIARFEKDVRVPAYGGAIMFSRLSSALTSSKKCSQAKAVAGLFHVVDTNRDRPFLVKDTMSYIKSSMQDDLIADGFKKITLPRPK